MPENIWDNLIMRSSVAINNYLYFIHLFLSTELAILVPKTQECVMVESKNLLWASCVVRGATLPMWDKAKNDTVLIVLWVIILGLSVQRRRYTKMCGLTATYGGADQACSQFNPMRCIKQENQSFEAFFPPPFLYFFPISDKSPPTCSCATTDGWMCVIWETDWEHLNARLTQSKAIFLSYSFLLFVPSCHT